ncbi:MAG: hypothetical protein K1X92_06430 [Bacteroidia bacterium]|nr:hypothetical protein [Bacteroidia bacterium]
MKNIFGFCLSVLLPMTGLAQASGFSMGLNVANAPLGSVELNAEYPLKSAITLRMGLGLRQQPLLSPTNLSPSFLKQYRDLQNKSIGSSVGFTFADHYAKSYPYFGLDLNGVYVNDIYADDSGEKVAVKGYTGGVMLGLGFVLPVTSRINIDIAGKIGYTKPLKDDRNNYFLPLAGYTLSGTNESLSQKFITFMPSVTLKYTLIPVAIKPVIPVVPDEVMIKDLEAKLD